MVSFHFSQQMTSECTANYNMKIFQAESEDCLSQPVC